MRKTTIASRVQRFGLALLLCAAAADAAEEASSGDQDRPKDGQAAANPAQPPRREEFVEVEGELPVPTTNLTIGRMPLPILKTPASVGVVPRTLFEEQHALVLGDALRNVSGVGAATGFGVFDFFVIRGFDSLSSGLVLVDGAPEPESTFYPLYNVSRVEVLKGPAAFLYGANPLSGAVHLVRKQPLGRKAAELTASLGSFDTWEATADASVGSRGGTVAARLNAMYRDSDGYRDGRTGSMFAVNPALVWRPDRLTRLGASVEVVASDFAPDSGLPLVMGSEVASVPRTRSYQSPFDDSDQDVLRLRLDAERRLSDRVLLRDKLYFTSLDWRSQGTLLNGAFPVPGAGVLVARTMLMLDDRQSWLGNQAEAVVSFTTGKAAHDLVAGIELARLGDEFTLDVGVLPLIGLLEPFETARQPVPAIPGLSSAGDARSVVIAPYVLDRVRLSRQVELLVGARLDVLDYEDPVSATTRDDRQLSPLGGILFSPTPDLSLYANAGRAFAPPSTLVVGEREPERSRQVEVGAKKSFAGGRAFATVAAFHIERDGIAIPEAGGALRQIGSQRSRGLEAELWAEAGRDWFWSVSYAFTEAELTRFTENVLISLQPPAFALLDRAGNAPAFAPRHQLGVWARRRLADRLTLGAGARYVSSHFIAEDNAYRIPGYLLLDAAATYDLGRTRFSVNLKNLTDREYETRGFGSTSVLPGRPFSVSARVELALGER